MRFAHLNRDRRLAVAEVDRFLVNSHIAPLAVPLILQRIVGIDGDAIQVLYVGADVGDAPRDAVVVAGDDAGRGGQGHTRHVVGAGLGDGQTVQADFVPDGGHLNAEVRVVGQHRLPAFRHCSGGNPVVAADAGVFGGAGSNVHQRAGYAAGHARQNRRGRGSRGPRAQAGVGQWQVGLIENGRFRRVVIGIGWGVIGQHLGAGGFDDGLAFELIPHRTGQVPGHHLAPHQRVEGRPRLDGNIHAGDAKQAVFHRQVFGRAPHNVGIYAFSERFKNDERFGVNGRQVFFGVAIPASGADEQVIAERALIQAGQFADRALAGVAVELHLPPAILRLRVALGEEQVVRRAGVDVRNTIGVAQDFDGSIQPGHADRTAGLRQRAFRRVVVDEKAAQHDGQ